MELRQLRYFVEVFDRGSLSSAAKALLVSQPALTRQIQQLERECGVPLFERVPAGVVPTSAGTAFYQHVLGLLRYADTAKDAARDAGPVREIVQVGLAPGLPPTWLEQLIDTVRAAVPQAYLSLNDAISTVQLQDLRAGRLDIAFVHESPAADLVRHRVLEEPLGLVVDPRSAAEFTGTTCPLRNLDGMDILAHARDQVPIGHDRLVSAAHVAGIRPRWHFANYTENARACLRATGAEGAILSRTTAGRLLPGWEWRRLVDPPITMQTWIARQAVARGTVTAVTDAIVAAFGID
ncbi:LysR family transcriptional regulator [Nocardia sp. NBC_00416]|uniref:LysR family transcriptional regulator n=1 Tax=Nocardia sp. NBC_00416 TaxID=2975991 RepID=UPI002E1CCA59